MGSGKKTNSRALAQSWQHIRYKEYEKNLRANAARWFEAQGKPVRDNMKYCLKNYDDWPDNIIYDGVVDLLRKQHDEKRFPLHRWIHHGLSSQAMTLNLVGPLIVKDDLEPLRNVLENVGIIWPSGTVQAELEYSDRDVFNEDAGQPTCIDLALLGDENPLFIEVKMVEKEFGGCSVFAGGDCDGQNPLQNGLENCFLHHIDRKYWEKAKDYGFLQSQIMQGQICPFTNYYQFYREILFAIAKKGSFVLLHDERNPTFLRMTKDGRETGLWPFLTEHIPDEHKSKVGRITIQKLAHNIQASGNHNEWIDDFYAKYDL